MLWTMILQKPWQITFIIWMKMMTSIYPTFGGRIIIEYIIRTTRVVSTILENQCANFVPNCTMKRNRPKRIQICTSGGEMKPNAVNNCQASKCACRPPENLAAVESNRYDSNKIFLIMDKSRVALLDCVSIHFQVRQSQPHAPFHVLFGEGVTFSRTGTWFLLQ